jgi:plastocyanin
MRQFTTQLALPAVTAGIATLAGAAIAVGILTSPSTAAAPPATRPTPAASEHVMPGMSMPGMSMPLAGGPGGSLGQDTPVATNTVAIQNFAFSPAIVTVKAGTPVTWTNRDQDSHTATAMSGVFHSPTLNTGQSYHYTFTTPGRFDYLCTIHPFMTATVVVTP